MDGLMPIGEFSDRSGLSSKRLRTYAAESLLVPAAVDPVSGYRYYSPAQLPVAGLIDALRDVGIPLADIRAFLSHPSQSQLDAWAQELVADSRLREHALALARRLLMAIEARSLRQRDQVHQEVPSMTTLRTAGRTDIGLVRAKNQDAIVANDRVAMVADGMGGPPGGHVAAAAVIGAVQAAFTGRSVEELQAAIRAANWSIWDRAAAEPELEGMGTTVCAVGVLDDGRLALVNVGDSRAYLWREGTLTQLTRDHSVTAELVERGELRNEEASRHPHYGILTRALGVGPTVDLDCMTLTVEPGDRLVLCSDGLFNELSTAEISSVVAEQDEIASTVDSLIERALHHGGRDNVAVIIAEAAA